MNNFSLLLPAAAAVIIIIFYMGLPELAKTETSPVRNRAMTGKDAALLAVITAVYAFTAFFGLGNRQSPQTYRAFDGDFAVLELEELVSLGRVRVLSGINTGTYTFEVSPDGVDYTECGTLDQHYNAVLKWHDVELSPVDTLTRYVRISAEGRPFLYEAVFFDSYGSLISAQSEDAPELCDETELVPAKISFLNSCYFDEIYHARTALEHIIGLNPYETSHPPLGKLIIGLGISLFGMTPFGWRFMGTLFGVLMLPILYIFCKKLFGGTLIPSCCTAIFAFDFMHYVQTRIATIDTYAVFFILLMYLFMYLFVTTDEKRFLALSGVFFGIGCASKWTCIYAGTGLALIWLVYWVRRVIRGEKHQELTAFVGNILFCIGFFVLIPVVIYYASYYPYGRARGMEGIGMYFTREYAELVLSNQHFMFTYHVGVDATHPYSSRWYQWMLDIRPILYYLDRGSDGTRQSFGAFVNPALCWGGLLALFVLVYEALFRGDRKAGFILIGYLAQLVPWMFVGRITFEYHYFPCTVFLTLALGYVFSLMEHSTGYGKARIIGFTLFSISLFILFYPALSGVPVNSETASALMKWLGTWPLVRLIV